MIRREAITSGAPKSEDAHPAHPREAASVNLMMATWVVGVDADPEYLIEKLRMAAFTVIVVVFSTTVADRSQMRRFFEDARDQVDNVDEIIAKLLKEKLVERASRRIYVCVNRAKVYSSNF